LPFAEGADIDKNENDFQKRPAPDEGRSAMSHLDWKISGNKIGACNCNYGCPCEFNAPPTYGACEGLEAMEIEEGYFGDVRLDGVRYAAKFRWPGPVHEGHGEGQAIIDERASEAQREALLKILSGEEQEPTTVFNIYGSTIETEFETVIAPIAFEWDVEALTGKVHVPGVLDVVLTPILNPVTGKPHRAVIHLPEGFEFKDCVMVSSTFTGHGDIAYENTGRYGQLWHAAYGPRGIIEGESHRPAFR
jgi:hypothetical protein